MAGRAPWRLTVHGEGDFSDGGQPPAIIPIERLAWRASGEREFRPMAVRPAPLESEGALQKSFPAGGYAQASFAIDLRLRLEEGDARSPRPFRTTLVFTATSDAAEPIAARGGRGGRAHEGHEKIRRFGAAASAA